MIIYLCVKTHSKTGLKYLCKTIQDPFKYCGSGVDWKKHLKEHGKEHTTKIIKECASHSELAKWGRYFSHIWNVADSNEWANRIPETGAGSGSHLKGKTRPETTKQKIKQNHHKNQPEYVAPNLGNKHPMRQSNIIEKFKGENNYQTKPEFKYNSMTFTWKNKITNEIVTMSHLEFYKTYNLRSCNVVRTIKGKTKSVGGWELV